MRRNCLLGILGIVAAASVVALLWPSTPRPLPPFAPGELEAHLERAGGRAARLRGNEA